jgi:NAD(P)-dependent dehydrogenase (short-subunit alcohol dehydrogenase family)
MTTENVVLITGCSSGMGRVAAEYLARKKYRVFASLRSMQSRNRERARDLEALGKRESLPLHVLELDITDDGSVDRAVSGVIREVGRIDVLVNNAGVSVGGLTEAVTIEQARRVLETNFLGVLRMNRAVLPGMRSRGSGLLIHVSSLFGRIVAPGLGLYNASKFALEALAETYHYELAGEGIDSVIIEPGRYATNIGQNRDRASDVARMSAYGPAGRIPETILRGTGPARDPQEVADAILRLIEMPAGGRPLRTPVGVPGDSLNHLNRVSEQAQEGFLNLLGLAPLTKFRTRGPSTDQVAR